VRYNFNTAAREFRCRTALAVAVSHNFSGFLVHRSLRAMFDWSYGTLTSVDQIALQRMALLATPLDLAQPLQRWSIARSTPPMF
jgi:hypothetical protein